MNHQNLFAKKISIGKNTHIEPTAIIRGLNGLAEEIYIGDNVYIGHYVEIICDWFAVGDYGKIHHHTNIHGYQPCHIGHNLWCGQHSVIDSIGGTTIGNNCGIGAYSQLWSHIKYGDTLEGCRFYSQHSLNIGNDVWFVGHCVVSPITAHDKSMALLGSVITDDMLPNTLYGGVPARDMTDKMGRPFEPVTIENKLHKMKQYVEQSGINPDAVRIVRSINDIEDDGRSYFAVDTRQYLKLSTTDEVNFMKYLLPQRAKFVPYNQNPPAFETYQRNTSLPKMPWEWEE